MNKERIVAARKKLKEFQRIKQKEVAENTQEPPDLHKHNIDQKTSSECSLDVQQDSLQHFHHNMELMEDNGSIDHESTNTHQSSYLFNNADYANKFAAPVQEYTNIQTIHPDPESINGNADIPSHKNFFPDHSRNESSSTISSSIVNDNIDQNNFQNVPIQQFENLNTDSNMLNNTSSSLQKEHLLQMANAVANVLTDEQSLDESTLINCDLEQRNQFLTCCLDKQKQLTNQLHILISQSNSRVSELEAIIATKDAEFDSRLIREVNPLKEQVQLDAQTIGILVAEKAELTATNSQCQAIIKQKTEEVVELSGKLKASQQRINELEREVISTKNNVEELTLSYQKLQKDNEEVSKEFIKLKKENENFELELSELRQKLNYKNTELGSLQQDLQEKIALLSLSELRLQQLSNSSQEISSLETQHHTTKVLEHQLNQMKEALENVNTEKDEVNKKYQSYVQQLDERHTKLATELETSKKIIAESEIREQSYIQRLSELEQQLQREKAKSVKPVEDQSAKIELLTKSMDNLALEHENLQSLLNEKDNEMELLKKELKELQEIKEQSVEASKLVNALQSEQLGASRAVSQNQQLKTQLDEMHDAFISLSNTKLDLTEQLQAERTIGRKLNAKLNDVEQQVDELKEQLQQKEAALLEFEKEKLRAAQIEDQIHHYQAQSNSAVILQQELQKSFIMIESLKQENRLLQTKLEEAYSKNNAINVESSEEINKNTNIDSNTNSLNTEENLQNGTIDNKISNIESVMPSENSSVPIISEPFKKLEERFKDTMDRVAELTDEKQRLEHLVLQLQGETETIGEYVTLYQKQRAILQEKARQKENTFNQLLEQRNEQQEQLHKLKVLVGKLIKAKNANSNVTTATIAEEAMPLAEYSAPSKSNNIEVIDGHVNKIDDVSDCTDNTTSQILDLLSEIKDCNACTMEPSCQACPWCSGKLITV